MVNGELLSSSSRPRTAFCLLSTAYCRLRQSLKTWYRNPGQLCGF